MILDRGSDGALAEEILECGNDFSSVSLDLPLAQFTDQAGKTLIVLTMA